MNWTNILSGLVRTTYPTSPILSTPPIPEKLTKTLFDSTPVGSLLNSFIDNAIRDTVTPIPGSIVHCALYGAEHSGVYIGNNQIVELNGNGKIKIVSPKGFISGTNAMTIYVACHGTQPLGSQVTAICAKQMVGSSRNYNLILDNCHQFTAGCLYGDFENSNNFFWMLEFEIEKRMNKGRSIEWRAWDLSADELI